MLIAFCKVPEVREEESAAQSRGGISSSSRVFGAERCRLTALVQARHSSCCVVTLRLKRALLLWLTGNLKAEGTVRERQMNVRSAAAAGPATEVPTPTKQHNKMLPLDSPG